MNTTAPYKIVSITGRDYVDAYEAEQHHKKFGY